MKFFLTFCFFIIFMQTSFASNHCERNSKTYLCPKDTVISPTGYVGKVIGLNPHSLKIAVRWHTNPKGYSRNTRETMSIRKLSVGKGCLSYFCVGDTAISPTGFVGKVIGVNPHLSKIAVRWHTNPKGYSRNLRQVISIKSLSIGRGCVYGLCTQDKVISPTGFVGVVIGVNPFTYKAAVRWHTNPNGYSRNLRQTMDIQDLAIEKYCALYSYEKRSSSIHISYKGDFEIEGYQYRFSTSK